jgi:hypothetical protein
LSRPSIGGSVGISAGASAPAANSTPATPTHQTTSPVKASTNVTPASASLTMQGRTSNLSLPSPLVPRLEPSRAERTGLVGPLVPSAGTPTQIVQMCRSSVMTAALPYGAIRVEAVSAGQARPMPDGGLSAPIEVRVVYARANARQVRQSRVACRLNANGAVVALR